jgi:hypothetical protein
MVLKVAEIKVSVPLVSSKNLHGIKINIKIFQKLDSCKQTKMQLHMTVFMELAVPMREQPMGFWL